MLILVFSEDNKKPKESVSQKEKQTNMVFYESFQQESEKLWQQLQIDFQLEAFRFPDNKIYGIININPESSRKLIKRLFVSYMKSFLSFFFFSASQQ